MTRGYSVKFVEQEIVVTKKFLKAAEVYGTEEFVIMLNLTKELPHFRVREKIVYRNYAYRNIEVA